MGKKSQTKSTAKKKGTSKKKAKDTAKESKKKVQAKAKGKKQAAKSSKKKSGAKKAPSISSLLKRDFGTWKPATLFVPPADSAGNDFSAPPVVDPADKKNAKKIRALLSLKFDLTPKKTKAAPKKEKKATPKTKKAPAKKKAKPTAAKKPKAKETKPPKTIPELLAMKFPEWKPEKLYSPKPEEASFQAPEAFEGLKDKNTLIFRKFTIPPSPAKQPGEEKTVSKKDTPAVPPEEPAETEAAPEDMGIRTEPASAEATPPKADAPKAAPVEPAQAKKEEAEPESDKKETPEKKEPEKETKPPTPEPEAPKEPEKAQKQPEKTTTEGAKETAEKKEAAEKEEGKPSAKPEPSAGVKPEQTKQPAETKPEPADIQKEKKEPSVKKETEAKPRPVVSERPVSPETRKTPGFVSPPLPPLITEEPPGKGLWMLVSVIAAIFALLFIASIQNASKYSIEITDSGVKIWKGNFSPTGRHLFKELQGATIQESMKGSCTRKEAYKVIFDHLLSRIDAMPRGKGIPDFEKIKAKLNEAEQYAVTGKEKQEIQKRRNRIDSLIYLYKAEALAEAGTPQALADAVSLLEKAHRLAPGKELQEAIKNKISRYNKKMGK